MMRAISCEQPMRLTAAFVVLLLLAALAVLPAQGARAEANVLRLHILANSDSPADQRVKLLLRDAVLALLPASASAAESEAYLLAHGRELLSAAERTLRANGLDYGAQLLLGKCDFPDRTYDGKTYPAGEYEALRIVLGRGAGQNWWCVLFPPLCIVTVEEEPLPAPDELEFESSVLTWLRDWRERS